MNVGFTGTLEGMSPSQRLQLSYVLALFKHADQAVGRTPTFHDGDAYKGADREARGVALYQGYESQTHPPSEPTAKALLLRNRIIVASCEVLIAAPFTNKEELRSGTWATVRYARQAGKPVVMLSR